MHLSDIVGKLNYKITGGSEYQWFCYPNARFLNFESKHADVSVVFNTSDQTVYEITTDSKLNKNNSYRWIDPGYIDGYYQEAKDKGINPAVAYDNVLYFDLETENDIIEKATAIFHGLTFDTRVEMELTLDDETLLAIARGAHERDITINKFIEEVLQTFIENKE